MCNTRAHSARGRAHAGLQVAAQVEEVALRLESVPSSEATKGVSEIGIYYESTLSTRHGTRVGTRTDHLCGDRLERPPSLAICRRVHATAAATTPSWT